MKKITLVLSLALTLLASSLAFGANKEIRFKVRGITCGGCQAKIKSKFQKKYPKQFVDFKYTEKGRVGSVTVTENSKISLKEIQAVVSSAGHYIASELPKKK